MEKVTRFKTFDGKYFEDEESASSWEQAHYRDVVWHFYFKMESEVKKINLLKKKVLPGIEKILLELKEFSQLEYEAFSEKVGFYAGYLVEHSPAMEVIRGSNLKGKSRRKLIKLLFLDLKMKYQTQIKGRKLDIRKLADEWKQQYPGKNVYQEYHHLFIKKNWS